MGRKTGQNGGKAKAAGWHRQQRPREQKPRLTFLSLPRKVRDRIYGLILLEPEPVRVPFVLDDKNYIAANRTLLAFNFHKVVYDEACEFYFTRNRFEISDTSGSMFDYLKAKTGSVHHYFKAIGPKNSSRLRHIVIAFPSIGSELVNVKRGSIPPKSTPEIFIEKEYSTLLRAVREHCVNIRTITAEIWRHIFEEFPRIRELDEDDISDTDRRHLKLDKSGQDDDCGDDRFSEGDLEHEGPVAPGEVDNPNEANVPERADLSASTDETLQKALKTVDNYFRQFPLVETINIEVVGVERPLDHEHTLIEQGMEAQGWRLYFLHHPMLLKDHDGIADDHDSDNSDDSDDSDSDYDDYYEHDSDYANYHAEHGAYEYFLSH